MSIPGIDGMSVEELPEFAHNPDTHTSRDQGRKNAFLNLRDALRRQDRHLRRYLEAGVMANGVVMERHMGTPQGGPLSPLLANVLLDEVDKELELRGHAFVR